MQVLYGVGYQSVLLVEMAQQTLLVIKKVDAVFIGSHPQFPLTVAPDAVYTLARHHAVQFLLVGHLAVPQTVNSVAGRYPECTVPVLIECQREDGVSVYQQFADGSAPFVYL